MRTIDIHTRRFDTTDDRARRRDELIARLDEDGLPATLANLVGEMIAPLALAPATLLSVIGWMEPALDDAA